jgi:hypothetical protein
MTPTASWTQTRPVIAGADAGGQSYRFDHAFITKPRSAQVRACGYLQEPRQQNLTDYAARALTVDLNGGAHHSDRRRGTR